jgi:hypothetical protein
MKLQIFLLSLLMLVSCGSGDTAKFSNELISEPSINISYTNLPDQLNSYQKISMNVSSNYLNCNYALTGSDIHWVSSSGNLFEFNAPATVLDMENLNSKSIPFYRMIVLMQLRK